MSLSVTAMSLRHDRALQRLIWLAFALFLSYLGVAISLPVTSVFVATELGFGNVWAGLAVGIAFVSTIATRAMAGRIADRRGGKQCMVRGLCVYVLAGMICIAASVTSLSAEMAYAVLIAGRLLLGVGESMAMVGLLAWGFGIMGVARSGRVLAVVGMSLYGAYAVGSPIGLALFDWLGFEGVMITCTLVPLIGLVMALPVGAIAPHAGERPSFWTIIGRIWEPGLVVGLQGVGFAVIGAFISLLFINRGWPHAGLGLTCFGGAFVLVRILFGDLPDRLGGTKVALVSMLVEAAGQYLLWMANGPELALLGAFMTGLGCSMIFPSMGVEVVHRVPPHLRGTAMGGFAAFQDLAYGFTGPVTGLLADQFGYSVVFLVGGVAASLGLMMVVAIARQDRVLPP